MKNLPKYLKEISSKSAYTLLELLVVLSITGVMMSIVVYGAIKFRQTMTISSTAKEIVLYIRKARRYSINNVLTSDRYSTTGYYVEILNNDYSWGECRSLGCSVTNSVKSAQFDGVDVSGCESGSDLYTTLKFNHVTGEFVITNDKDQTDPTPEVTCIIRITIPGAVSTTREIEISGSNRTIKIL